MPCHPSHCGLWPKTQESPDSSRSAQQRFQAELKSILLPSSAPTAHLPRVSPARPASLPSTPPASALLADTGSPLPAASSCCLPHHPEEAHAPSCPRSPPSGHRGLPHLPGMSQEFIYSFNKHLVSCCVSDPLGDAVNTRNKLVGADIPGATVLRVKGGHGGGWLGLCFP